jgi:hypothetical protein
MSRFERRAARRQTKVVSTPAERFLSGLRPLITKPVDEEPLQLGDVINTAIAMCAQLDYLAGFSTLDEWTEKCRELYELGTKAGPPKESML